VRRIWHGTVDFVVGDDLSVAVSVLLLLGAAAIVVQAGGDAWWLLAAGVPVALWLSLLRARRSALREGEPR